MVVTLKERRLHGGDAADWTARGSTLRKVSKLVSSPKSPGRRGGGSSSLIFNGYGGGEGGVHNEELSDLYSLPNIV